MRLQSIIVALAAMLAWSGVAAASSPAVWSSAEAFSKQRRLLHVLPPDDVGQAVERTLELMASAIESAPKSNNIAVGEAGQIIRSDAQQLLAAFPPTAATAQPARDAIATAAGTLALFASGPFSTQPQLAMAVRTLQEAVSRIDGRRTIPQVLPQIIQALDDVDAAFHQMAATGPSTGPS